MAKNYRPPQEVLARYADLLINFALGSGKGIKKGEIVRLIVDESAKPLFVELRRAIWKSGGHVISVYRPSNDDEFNVDADFFNHAKDHQLDFFPHKYYKGIAETVDHTVVIMSDTNKKALADVDPKDIMRTGLATKPWQEWIRAKENEGKYTWTLALYGTPAMAKEVGLSLEEYWNQIIKACFLDKKNTVKVWKDLYKKLAVYQKKLNALDVDKFHIKGPDADLWITQGDKRLWIGGSGRNIPSFELFTSPDWRGTNGWIRFNQPLYRYGNMITGIELWFENGKVVKSKADKNYHVLKHMIATENADKVGEFSMTDKRFSRITKFMGETLFDENVGGPHGNTHIALGKSYHDCYNGDPSKVTKEGWAKLGYNNSTVHTDIISTAPRTVTAHMKDGSTKVIYKNGMYNL